ncbi:hypothetical protein GCM10009792_22720 [Microcella alkalica]|uniref:Glycerol-1-phosphate dehydrogenase [NAD(P)+] n=1 Tax=Microcella alkalica TaxID=355930 RepID=A0A839E6U5_9MICO|nr:iron-containing alcohol dehydrogenase [Microcella alkalica]MBA8848191.1 glycerol-1-phosphate dehydrogenase [NAD(P)+] [Microcella alkalica]
MSLFESISDPTDLDALRRVVAESTRPEALVPLGIDRLAIGPGAALAVADELHRLIDRRRIRATRIHVLLIADATLIRRGEADLKALVRNQLDDHGFAVETLVLGDREHSLHADDDALDAAAAAAARVDAVVSVGSGTISDIAKVATDRAGGIPFILVQTAASVDGYTDNVSVILRAGAKRTIPSRWPDVVLADTTTIATAPTALNTSGFGELLSLYTAPADWWLASRIGLDPSFHETPRDLLLAFAGSPREWGAGLADGAPAAVEQLTRVLAIRGIGTGIAGTTACLSGVEHLVSHMLDMHAAARGLETGLHGAQVGVASLVAAAAWEHLLARLAAESATRRPVDRDAARASVEATFASLDPSGALAGECWADVARKLDAVEAAGDRIDAVLAELPTSVAAGEPALMPVDDVAAALRVAGAAASPAELQGWIDDDIWQWAVAHCHRMRNRFTVVDLLDLLGWWESADVGAVLRRAKQAGEGVLA